MAYKAILAGLKLEKKVEEKSKHSIKHGSIGQHIEFIVWY
jgi:hypothetical protein